jgi:hypothetical protein
MAPRREALLSVQEKMHEALARVANSQKRLAESERNQSERSAELAAAVQKRDELNAKWALADKLLARGRALLGW